MIVSELVSLLGFRTDMSGANNFDKKLSDLQGRSNAVTAGISAAFANMALNIAANFAAALGSIPVRIAQSGDAMVGSLAKIESSIGRSATSAAEAEGLYEDLYQMGTRTGVAADESASAFTRFNLAMVELGRPASDTIALIEGIQAAGIVAGVSTGELSASMLQLGQALASGKLQGDELKSLRENMPRFLQDVTKALGLTTQEFFDQAEKGLLTPGRIVPALLKASEGAREELKNFPLTMSRSFSILTNSATRFMAELDKQLGLSKSLANLFSVIARTLDSWRSGLSVVGDLVRELGGLEGIARYAGIALLVAFGPALLGSVGALVGIFGTLARTILISLLPLAGMVAWFLVIEDFIGWMQGKDSLFGDKFGGTFEETIDKLTAGFQERLQAWIDLFGRVGTAIVETWDSTIEQIRPLLLWIEMAVEPIKVAFGALATFFEEVFNKIVARIQAFVDKTIAMVSAIRGALSFMEGGGTGSDPERQGEQRGNMGRRGGASGFYGDSPIFDPSVFAATVPDMSGRLGGSSNSMAQSNAITNQITVNAPGADPASVAAGAQSGMRQATGDMTTRLGNAFALGLGIANPRVEAAAQ